MGNWVTFSTAGSSGYTPPPNAPNITSASCSAYYGMQWNGSAFGLQSVSGINLPTSDPNYSHLKEIDISATMPDGHTETLPTLYAPFIGSTASFKGPCDNWQIGASQSLTLTFVCKNDAGIATGSPTTCTVTVAASVVVAGFSASDSGTRTVDSNRSVSAVINWTPMLGGGIYPQNVTSWLPSAKDITKYTCVGWTVMAGSSQVITTSRLVPAAAATWHVYCAAGAVPYDGSLEYSASDLAALGAVASAGFSMAGIPAPAGGTVTSITAGSITSMVDKTSGWQWAELMSLSWVDPTDPSWLVKFYVRETDSAGNPASDAKGSWREWFESQIASPGGTTRYADTDVYGGVLEIAYRAASDTHHYLQIQCVTVNRLSTNPGDWAGSNTASSTAQGSVIQLNFGTLPAGLIPLNMTDPATLDPSLVLKSGGLGLNTSDLSNMVLNPSFEQGFSAWNSYFGPTPFVGGVGSGVPVFSGLNACVIYPDPTSHTGAIREVIPHIFTPGTGVFARVDVFGNGACVGTFNLVVQFQDASGAFISNSIPAATTATIGSWQRVQVITQAAPAGTSQIQIRLFCSGETGVGAAWIVDNVYMTPIVPGTNVTDIVGPSNSGLTISCPISAGATLASGVPTYCWDGTITPSTDPLCVGYEVTVQYAGSNEGGAFAKLGPAQLTFHNGDWPKPASSIAVTFRCYPMSRDGHRGTAATYSTTIPAASTFSLSGTQVTDIPGPTVPSAFAVTIVNGPTSPTGAETYGWTGTITPPSDPTYSGAALTQQWAGGIEGGAFQTLGPTATTFASDNYYPRGSAAINCTFRAYPLSRDGKRGTPYSVTVSVGAHSTGTLDTSQADPTKTTPAPHSVGILGGGVASLAASGTGYEVRNAGSTVTAMFSKTGLVTIDSVGSSAYGQNIQTPGKCLIYNNVATVGMGVPPIYFTALVYSSAVGVSATAMTLGGSTPPAGLYRVTCICNCTVSGTGNAFVIIRWNDGYYARAAGASITFSFLGNTQTAVVLCRSNGSAITYECSYAGTGSYGFDVVMERIG
jgi:hypothetical protein